jgi:hypothetical protein
VKFIKYSSSILNLKALGRILDSSRIYTQTSAEDHKAERELFEKSLCGFKAAQ